MDLKEIFLIIIQLTFSIFLIQITFIILGFLFFKKGKVHSKIDHLNQFAILIPSYLEGEVLVPSINSLLVQKYPKDKFDIYLIADCCESDIIEHLKKLDITIFQLKFEISSKVNSLKFALERIKNKYDAFIILDADNLSHPNFLFEINKSMNDGASVVQGIRVAKNLESFIERLDCLTDVFYNFIDRVCPSNLNLSATLSGSGFGIECKLFRSLLDEIDVLGGFDKALQSRLVLGKHKIAFNRHAIVYDEKVSDTSTYITQRTRWIHSYFRMMRSFGPRLLLSSLKNFNLDGLNYSVLTFRPPLTILTFLSLFFWSLNIFTQKYIMFVYWSVLLILLFTGILYSLFYFGADKKMFTTFLFSPVIFMKHLFSILNIKKAKKNSMKTKHTKVISIEEVLDHK